MTSGKVAVENVNVPGQVTQVEAKGVVKRHQVKPLTFTKV